MNYQALSKYLRVFGRNGFTRRAPRLVSALALALLLPIMASAYTVVLRGGRRVEIPATFTVTKWTLTYEAAPGINVTLQMATIDIPATERANNEPAGALLRRASRPATSATGAANLAQSRPPRRELTRQDIESARLARVKSEQEYERRRVELGLPSLEETRRRAEEETRRLGEMSRQAQADEAQAESYWRARSSELRTEMAALDAQINYVRARLSEIPEVQPFFCGNALSTTVPTVSSIIQQTHGNFPVLAGNPGFMHGTTPDAPMTGFLGFGGGGAQGQVRINTSLPRGPFVRRGGHRHRGTGRGAVLIGTPYPDYGYPGERGNLIWRLQELETVRAGLQARWRQLEEDARRAGAPPGWLRQ